MKLFSSIILNALALFLIVAILGTALKAVYSEHQADYIPQMSVACEKHQHDCQKLIDKVQAGGDYEVLSDNEGHYWAEGK